MKNPQKRPIYVSDSPLVGFIAMLVSIVAMCGVIIFSLSLVAAKVWLLGSLVTSSVKAGTGNCSVVYPIEKVLSGNWFCPSKE